MNRRINFFRMNRLACNSLTVNAVFHPNEARYNVDSFVPSATFQRTPS